MSIDASPDDLDALRELVAQLSSERDAALEECRCVTEQNDRLRHLLQQLRRAQFGRRSERLDPEQLQCMHPTSAVLSDAWYFAKRVTLSLALRSSGDAGRGFGRVGAAAALVA